VGRTTEGRTRRSGDSAIYFTDYAKSEKPQPITAGAARAFFNEHGSAWSADSKHLAFLSGTARKGQLQLYVTDLAGRPAQKLSNAKGLLATPKRAPDGKSIAILNTENALREAGPLVAEVPETGVVKDAFFEQRLVIVNVAEGTLRAITPEDTYIYEYDWAPDSTSLVATAAKGTETTTGGSRNSTSWTLPRRTCDRFTSRSCRSPGPRFRPMEKVSRSLKG
jgi:Tol biopolymer transport system component